MLFFFSSRRRHTRLQGDWSSDVCSSDLLEALAASGQALRNPDCQIELRDVDRFTAANGHFELGRALAPPFEKERIAAADELDLFRDADSRDAGGLRDRKSVVEGTVVALRGRALNTHEKQW